MQDKLGTKCGIPPDEGERNHRNQLASYMGRLEKSSNKKPACLPGKVGLIPVI
ncbi:protein of unknown function [Aminobacter niigataensis]|nr:protein of unknown function [Aminobacter niigataensis]